MVSIADYEKTGKKLRDVTLCYLVKGSKVLIALKKRGFGAGKMNGIGGKVEPGESIEAAMIRETKEEIGVEPTSFIKVGTIDFYFSKHPEGKDLDQRVHVFLVYGWRGEPSESEEMKPEWVEKSKIPLEKMWADDKYWLPGVLSGDSIKAAFLFDENENVADHYVEVEGRRITIEDFAKIDLRVGKVLDVKELQTKKPMYALTVDLGELGRRNIAAGIRDRYASDELVGKRIIVVSNLEPKSIGGIFVSEGMILAAEDENNLSVITPEREIKEGSRIR
ncbi:MAG: NUDIX domain-containing protein [Candidatus Micrarchaeaceae archaeon]